MAKPTIRFKGYTDDWEQRKLGDVFKEYSEKNHTELPALTIIQGGGTVKREDSDRNLMYDKSNLSNYKMVRRMISLYIFVPLREDLKKHHQMAL